MRAKLVQPDYRIFPHELPTIGRRSLLDTGREVEKKLHRSELNEIIQASHQRVQPYLKANYWRLRKLNKEVKVKGSGVLGDLRHDMRVVHEILKGNNYLHADVIDELTARLSNRLRQMSAYTAHESIVRYYVYSYIKRHNGIDNIIRDTLSNMLVNGESYNTIQLNRIVEEYMAEFSIKFVEPFEGILSEVDELHGIRAKILLNSGLIQHYIDVIDASYELGKSEEEIVIDYEGLYDVLSCRNTYNGYQNTKYNENEQQRIEKLRSYPQSVVDEDKYGVFFVDTKKDNYNGNIVTLEKLPKHEIRMSPLHTVVYDITTGETLILNTRLRGENISEYIKATKENFGYYVEGTGVSRESIDYLFNTVSQYYGGISTSY